MQLHVELYPEDARALYLGAPPSSTMRRVCIPFWEKKTRTLDLIEKAVRNGYGHKEWLENDPDFASLHHHPRFQTLIQRLSAASTKSML
jgi:hypothetical protein